MDQCRHADPRFTLKVYTHTMNRRDGEKDRLPARVEGGEWPSLRTSAQSNAPVPDHAPDPETTESRAVQGIQEVGATGLEPVTSSLSSWRSPN
jgi:hypothetical protein